MVEVIGVRFRTAGKIYFFNPKEFQVKSGDHVIVETTRGIEFGSVVSERRQVKEKCIGDELKPVLRIATKEDEERAAKNREKEKEAYKICLDKIKEHELDMKLVSTEYTFDNNKVLFYFTADGRVDFRELVKDLAGQELNYDRSESEMKPRCLVVWESVEENYAVIHFYLSLHLFLSRWPKSRICH